jgi:K+-sensing histidine kinase KdpD
VPLTLAVTSKLCLVSKLTEELAIMLLFLICVVVSIIGNLWVVAKIWPVSKVYSFIAFIFFPAAIFFMFTHWGDEEHDIKVPFMLTLIAGIASVYLLDKLKAEYGDEDEDEEESWLYDGRYDIALPALLSEEALQRS